MSLLQVCGVVAGYGDNDQILKGVALDVRAGEVVVIIGPNGAGKSTLLKTVAGLIRPQAGKIQFNANEIQGFVPREVSRLGIAYVPQEHNIFASLSIRDNLEISSYLDRVGWQARAERNFQRFPVLKSKRNRLARTLSGGQRQSLAMAMGLMVNPTLMLLDEPSAGLSPVAAEELFDAIQSIAREGMTILMVEQNVAEALRIADRVYLLVDGRNARDGKPGDLAGDPDIRRRFFGV